MFQYANIRYYFQIAEIDVSGVYVLEQVSEGCGADILQLDLTLQAFAQATKQQGSERGHLERVELSNKFVTESGWEIT